MGYDVGSRIAELREKRGLSLTALAKLSGVSKSTLWGIERGEVVPTVSTLWNIANALGVTFGELITYDIVVKEEGVEVRLIEREGNREVYLMRLEGGSYRRASGHANSPVEVVHIIKGAMIVGPVDAPLFVWAGKTARFYGGVDHIYMAVGGEAEAVVTMWYFSRPARQRVWYVDTREPARGKYRDLLSPEGVRSKKLARAIKAINNRVAHDDGSLLFDVLSSEFKTLSGEPTLPKVVYKSVERLKGVSAEKATSFERNIDVIRYYIYEPLHPGYAEQAVYVAYELERRGVGEVISIGCGPAYREVMLKELIPVDVKCVEPSPFFKQLSPVPVIDGVPQGVNAIVSFGSPRHTANFLKMASEKLKSGGVLIVSDEFIDEYASEGARRRNVIKHHLGYLLDIPLVSYRDEMLSAYNASYKNLSLSLRILSRVYYEVYERVKTELYTTDVEMAFLNFYFLELTAMLLGVAYIEERKTSVERFISEASEVGLRLEAHYKVYSTGWGKAGAGTHVLVFVKT